MHPETYKAMLPELISMASIRNFPDLSPGWKWNMNRGTENRFVLSSQFLSSFGFKMS